MSDRFSDSVSIERLFMDGKYAEYLEIIQKSPPQHDFRWNAGYAALSLGRFDDAQEYFQAADKDDASGWSAYYLGYVYERMQNTETAIKEFKRASESGLPPASFRIGLILQKSETPNHLSASIDAFQNSANLGHIPAKIHLGRLKYRAGDIGWLRYIFAYYIPNVLFGMILLVKNRKDPRIIY